MRRWWARRVTAWLGGGVLGEREREGGLEGPVGERLEAAQ